jgi:hypothetical protein
MHFVKTIISLFALSSFAAAQYADEAGLNPRDNYLAAREEFLDARDTYLAARDLYVRVSISRRPDSPYTLADMRFRVPG